MQVVGRSVNIFLWKKKQPTQWFTLHYGNKWSKPYPFFLTSFPFWIPAVRTEGNTLFCSLKVPCDSRRLRAAFLSQHSEGCSTRGPIQLPRAGLQGLPGPRGHRSADSKQCGWVQAEQGCLCATVWWALKKSMLSPHSIRSRSKKKKKKPVKKLKKKKKPTEEISLNYVEVYPQ